MFFSHVQGQDSLTYAERLGFPKGKKVIIFHVDDAGMSFDSDSGAIAALTRGVATSCSVMMPCPWVPHFVHFLKTHPEIDAGLHLTLTSEWKEYRWTPLSGISQLPGLVDAEGSLWPDVETLVSHASGEEVETEIRAQIKKAFSMGFRPTHMDTHMGAVFASPDYLQRYVKLAVEFHLPVMLPAGHDYLISRQNKTAEAMLAAIRGLGKKLWNEGLPVIDDLDNYSYDWKLPKGRTPERKVLEEEKTQFYMDELKKCRPGVTMIIMHCTSPTEIFPLISDSGITREGDLLAMLNPKLKKYILKEGIILTTWRELSERRKRVN